MRAGPPGLLVLARIVRFGGRCPRRTCVAVAHGRDGLGGDTGPFHKNLVKCAAESSVTYLNYNLL